VPLAIFDLDNTLLAGDSDHLWGEFLCEEGLADSADFRSRVDAFYADYLRGALDMPAYLRFILAPTAGYTPAELAPLQQRFLDEKIAPIMLPAARQLIEDHRARGDALLIITATNDVVTRPIASAFGIPDLLASTAELSAGRYTGLPSGIPCLGEGKVLRLQAWLDDNPQLNLDDSCFYSDSHNDLPLLRTVTRPVVVDPDPRLAAVAAAAGWPRISLR
jgi:HAD superfamily hydrolase (TIGR01490 family)